MNIKSYLALIAIDLKLAMRMRAVIFFNYLFPLMFFFIFGMLFHARNHPEAMVQVLSMTLTMGVLGNGLFGGGIRAIQEREMNILRRYKVTPITPAPLLVGAMVTGWAIFLPYIVVMFALAHFYYHMPWPENLASLLVFVSVGQVAFRSIGLVIASVANSMQEGTILVQLCYFPMLFLSGATFPVSMFPRWLQVFTNFIPASYLVNGVKAMMQRGEGVGGAWKPLAALATTIVVGGFVGMKLFRWEKEEKIRTSAKLWILAVLVPFLLLGIWQAHR
ncbi:MAG TPA: ABC transporter permease [Terriglobales bacterium]|nr:ABC transporter permease [Terriglobales bacterium]